MPDETKVRPGDWVRFARGGQLVVGVVAYVRREDRWPQRWEAVTDAGHVYYEHILEVRSA